MEVASKIDDLKLPPEVFALRLQRRARLRDAIEQAMPDIDKAVESYNLDDYYQRALNLIISGRARKAFDLADRLDQMAGLAKRGPIARRRFWTSGGGSGAGSSADERGVVVPIEVDDRVTAH